jgi:hypothetical protein
MNSKNTGNYRLSRQQIGHVNTRTILSEHTSEAQCRNSYNNTYKDTDWEYYCEQEVIYTGTQLDENGNPIDSTPAWIRMDCN